MAIHLNIIKDWKSLSYSYALYNYKNLQITAVKGFITLSLACESGVSTEAEFLKEQACWKE